MIDVAAWLEELGLGEHAAVFAENGVDGAMLPELTNEDLKDLGVARLADRKKLLKAAARLDAEAPTTPESRRPEPARRPTGGGAERRQLTVMFVDLVGSTALSGRLDPELMREVILAYQNAVAGEVGRYEGHVAKFMGDGVLAYFGWPRAHEDDGERAVRAGLAIMQALAAMTAPHGEPLGARAGIATGLVVVGDLIGAGAAQEEAVVGETPNLAARLQAIAEPGQIVLAAATRRLIGDQFELRDLGPQTLKGISKAAEAFAVLGERTMDSRFEARAAGAMLPLVGRTQELDLLLERWRQARAGEGQMALLISEAGIGKSRITRAVVDAAAEDSHASVNYQCSPYHRDSAFHPAIQQLTRMAGLGAGDDSEAKRDKLDRLLADTAPDLGDAVSLIAELLGIDAGARYGARDLSPEQWRLGALRSLSALYLGLARDRPVLFVVEDAHWIDPTTLELIELLLERLADCTMLLLLTARPDFKPGFADYPVVTRLTLNRLGHVEIAAVIARVAGDKPLPQPVVDEIAARTDGVPLYVEELTKSVLESGILRETETAYRLDGSLEEVSIPSSLSDSLVARLDRLEQVKEIAQVAACIGREFDDRLLAAVSPLSEKRLQDGLDRLVATGLVFRHGRPPGASYTFKHALVQEAAYETLLKSRRQGLHGAIADTLIRMNGNRIDPWLLARHYSAAGRAEEAARSYLAAGRRSLAASALTEATGALERGLDELGSRAPSAARERLELDLRMALGTARIAQRGWAHPAVSEALEPAFDLADSLGDRTALGPVLWGLWVHYQTRTEFPKALDWLARLNRAAERTEDSELAIVRDTASGCQYFWQAEYARAAGHTAQLRADYDEARHARIVDYANHDPFCFSHHWAGSLLDWVIGYPERSRLRLEEALALARRLGHPFNLVFALTAGSESLLMRGEARRLLEHCDEAEAVAVEESLGAFAEQVLVGQWRGRAQIALGEHAAGYRLAKAGNDYWNQGGGRICNAMFWSSLIDGLAGQGRLDEARALTERALAHCRDTGDRWMEPEILRLSGELHLHGEPADSRSAEKFLREALALAREHGARSWELRAATSLARLRQAEERCREARELLAPVFEGFAEGFETADLKAARALLEALD